MYFFKAWAPVHCVLMQRFFTFFAMMIVTLFGVSCTPRSHISAEEVLRRTVIRSHTLDSASFTASVSAHLDGGKTISGSSIVQGVIQNSGMSWSLTSDFRIHGLLPDDDSSGNVSLLTPDGDAYYVRFDAIEGGLQSVLPLMGSGSANSWWKIGQSVPKQKYTRTIPDPLELDQAVARFTIQDFLPLQRGSDGRLEYRMNVLLSDEAMHSLLGQYVSEESHATGTLAIDAHDFTLRRTQWSLQHLQTPSGTLNVTFDIDLKDFDSAKEVVVPSGSSATLPLKDIFATFSL